MDLHNSSGKALSILTYHSLDTSGSVVSVAPADFVAQMACIASCGYRGITLREAISYRKAIGEWPNRSVVLTFDDGFRNFYEEAMPVLKRLNFSATVFVVSDHMGRHNDWETPPQSLGIREILTWPQAIELVQAGIEIGSHTKTHLSLRRLSSTESQQEIAGSRAAIEQHIGQPVTSFAYPFGETNAVSTECVKKEFHAACTTILQRANGDSLHMLPRVDMYYLRSERNLRRLLTGELDRYLALRCIGRSIRRAFMH